MNAGPQVRPRNSTAPTAQQRALVVDLDGGLLKTNLLLESVISLLKRRPWCIFLLGFWLLRGKANLKRQVARRVRLDVTVLPYREELVDYLKALKLDGSTIVLATAADLRVACQIADHLQVFDFVLASDGITNLSGPTRRDRLVTQFGEKGFECAGDDFRDAGGRSVHRLKSLRPQHWLKNLLVFIPLLAAHRLGEFQLLGKLILAFLAFNCAASSGYLLNDLLDLEADRRHPRKRLRTFASGDLPLSYGLVMIPILLGLGCVLGHLVSGLLLAAVATYFALGLTYSLCVKKFVIIDVIFLAGLYTMRVLAGSAAVQIWPSHWLLALSTFLFLSLALAKRYGELVVMKRLDGDKAKARAYEISDGELLSTMGIASGYLAVLVLALYINTDKAQALYGHYPLIWFLCPLLLYWISDMWLIAHRGRMPDDPLVFAMTDRTSRILIVLMFVVVALAL